MWRRNGPMLQRLTEVRAQFFTTVTVVLGSKGASWVPAGLAAVAYGCRLHHIKCVNPTGPTHYREQFVASATALLLLPSQRLQDARQACTAKFSIASDTAATLQTGAQQNSTTRHGLRWPTTCPTCTQCRPRRRVPRRRWSWQLR